MAIELRVLGSRDEHVLRNVCEGVFDNPINPRWTTEFLNDPRHHIAVSIDDGVVVGFASAIHYIHPDKPPQLWINEVSVVPTHQLRGFGKAMLRLLFAVGRAHNCRLTSVLTDRTNAAAMALYSSIGGREGVDDEGRAKPRSGIRSIFEIALGYATLCDGKRGQLASAGFLALGTIWMIATAAAYVSTRRRQLHAHREWMIRSYARLRRLLRYECTCHLC